MNWVRVFGLLFVAGLFGCENSGGGAYAKRVASPDELIGGTGALGAVGDWAIGNGHIRVIVQDQGWSRGFGIFGGGIIDADVTRPGASGQGLANGKDNFGEFFPALFLQAFDVADQELDGKVVPAIEVLNDGSNGEPAVLRTRATGAHFLTMVATLVDNALPARGLQFETDYIVRPGARHVEIVGRLINTSAREVDLSGAGLGALLGSLGGGSLQIPMGDVALFGAGNTVFAPGAVTRPNDLANPKPAGFDLRFSVDASYKSLASYGVTLPALPGLVVDFLATAGPGVSYGFAAGDSERNYVWLNRDQYGREPQYEPSKHSMLVPFLISSFTGAYFEVPPSRLPPQGADGSVFEYKRYFIIGDGDVSSIREELYRIRGAGTGEFAGRVVNDNGEPESDAWITVLDANKQPYSQIQPEPSGRFTAPLEPGVYYYRIVAEGRHPFPEVEAVDATRFEIAASESTYRYITLPLAPQLIVNVRDENGLPLPAKVSVVGEYDARFDGQDPATFLFDMSLGEGRRVTDLTWMDAPAQRERRFIEVSFYTLNGVGRALVRPSRCANCAPYEVVVSRGPEYDAYVQRNVDLRPGRTTVVDVVLRRAVDTTDFVSADFHVHSENSTDSFVKVESQVASAAAEGLEIAVSTDHNYVTDLSPVITRLGVQDFLTTITGVELTTLEMGHFNGFPVRFDPATPSHFPFVSSCYAPDAQKANKTAFDWVQCSPQQLFDNLRELGEFGKQNTIVQVNHPRDSILGYFTQFYMNPYTAVPEKPTTANYPETGFFIYPQNAETKQFEASKFSYDFDALEVFNGKRLDMLHAFRLPEDAPQDVVNSFTGYACGSGHNLNAPGEVLLRKGGYAAYPGAVDDWFNLLNNGHRVTATGNSDSHGADEELGSPRTYLYLPRGEDGARLDKDVQAITPLQVVEALRAHRAVATNAPFLDVTVRTTSVDNINSPCSAIAQANNCQLEGCSWNATANGCLPPPHYWRLGEMVEYAASNVGKPVDFEISVRTANWVGVQRLKVFANGQLVDTIELPQGNRPNGRAVDDDVVVPWRGTFARDVYVVVEAHGDHSMFPFVNGKEEPPSNVGEVVQGLAGGVVEGLAFGGGDGVSGPGTVQKAKPFALTNPIWLDIDANGRFDAPGNAPGPGPAAPAPPGTVCPDSVRRVEPTALGGMILAPPKRAGQHYYRWDIRKVFGAQHAH